MKRTEFHTGWSFCRKGEEMRPVQLPHDAMLEEKRNPKNPSGPAGAYFPGGIYVYEKTFTAPAEKKTMLLQFEGVYKNSTMALNGKVIGGADYGYIPFFVDLTEHLRWGEENTITVTADNSAQPNSRWYTGSGIYRPVWLWEGGIAHIAPEGIKITTLSIDPARIRAEVAHTGVAACISVLDMDGNVVTQGKGDSCELTIPNAKLWSAETPNLYRCCVTVLGSDGETDSAEVTFGIREITWNKNGFFVNGQSVKFRGGCVHHDNGLLGACSYPKSEERRIRILKECGFNAIRSAHNPLAASMLEACDRLGMYVMDETWDVWQGHKNPFDYALDFDKNWENDIAAMISRDYNHPSVVMYSIGNEISDPAKPEGVMLERALVARCHQLDTTRPVTAGLNLMLLWSAGKGMGVYNAEEGGMNEATQKAMERPEPKPTGSLFFNIATSFIGLSMGEMTRLPGVGKAIRPACDELDIVGYNYGSGRYKTDCKNNPDRLIVGSETFRPQIAKNWAMVETTPNLVGDFQWAAWDYLGEAGCGAWTYINDGNNFNKPYPWLVADSASVNILGYPTAEADLASAVWGCLKKPAIHVRPVKYDRCQTFKSTWRGTDAIPSWSWQGCEGKKAKVEVYFKADTVELLLNGKSVGKKKVKDRKAAFVTAYQPGKLEAVAYDAEGEEIARNQLVSAEGQTSIRLTPEDTALSPGEIGYVAVDIVGENGEIEANADIPITVAVENGKLLGFGSANPKTEESYLSGTFTTHYGRALAIVRAGQAGTVRIRATGQYCTEVEIEILKI